VKNSGEQVLLGLLTTSFKTKILKGRVNGPFGLIGPLKENRTMTKLMVCQDYGNMLTNDFKSRFLYESASFPIDNFAFPRLFDRIIFQLI
jgi:hypothetical protein